MSLSANTLFHFTKDIEILSLIIANKFKPSYSLEYFPGEEPKLPNCARAFPMVCFCDIRLTQITEHLSQYGQFGIGLEKEWGIRNGLSPVHYIHTNSPSYNGINKIFEYIRTHDLVNDLKEINKAVIDTKKYFKPYEGPIWNKALLSFTGHKTFYNEREWRYIFSLTDYIITTMSYYDFLNKKADIEERLLFNMHDVKYIVLESDKYVIPLKNKLINLNVPKEDVDIYISKVVTVQNVRNDF